MLPLQMMQEQLKSLPNNLQRLIKIVLPGIARRNMFVDLLLDILKLYVLSMKMRMELS